MIDRRTLALLAAVSLATVAGSAAAELITFDDIPAGRIGTQYLSRGAMFYVGDGAFGTSTGILQVQGAPLTANVGNFNTSISMPHIMNPGPGVPGNSDMIVHFFDAGGVRTLATSVGVFNDSDGNPQTIYIEGFDSLGASLGRTAINGGGVGGVFAHPAIYTAKVYPASGQFGNIGVDDFSFTVVPAPGTQALLATAILALRRRRRHC